MSPLARLKHLVTGTPLRTLVSSLLIALLTPLTLFANLQSWELRRKAAEEPLKTSYVDFRQLVVIYRQDENGNRLDDGQIEKIKNGLKFAKLFKWRNSLATFNTDLYFLILDKTPPADHCQEFWRPLESDLRSYLLSTYGDESYWDNIFDGIHFTGAGVSCAVGGGGSILGTARASSGIGRGEAVERPESGGDPNVDTDAAWYYLIENYRTLDCRWGGPVTDAFHHPHPHEFYQFPGQSCDSHQTSYQPVINAANDWDWDAKTFRAFAERGGFLEFFRYHLADSSEALHQVTDRDGDGLPDGPFIGEPPHEKLLVLERDELPPVSEENFGSNANCVDSDGDGYSDREEFTAGIFTATNPAEHGFNSCETPPVVEKVSDHPLYPSFQPEVGRASPSWDESPVPDAGDDSWTLIYDGYFYNEGSLQKTYAAWDGENFYLAVKTSKPGGLIWLDIDGSGESGYWAGMDSYRLRVNRYESGGKVYLYEPGPERLVPGAAFIDFQRDGSWITKIKIPRNLGIGHGFWGENSSGGLTLTSGRILGLRLKVGNTRLFEEHTFGQLILREREAASALTLAVSETSTEFTRGGLRIRWQTSQPSETVVRYGQTEGLKLVADKHEGLRTDHEVFLRNLLVGETFSWRIVSRPYDGWVYLGPLETLTVPYPPFAAGDNLALERPTFSNLSGETGEAVDGIKSNEDGNGWVPEHLNQQMKTGDFWQVDLLGEYPISGIRIYRDNYQDPAVNPYYHNIPRQFTVQTALKDDFSDAIAVVSESNFSVPSAAENYKEYQFAPVRGRYVRLIATADEDWVRLHELEVLAANSEAGSGTISGQIILEGRQDHSGTVVNISSTPTETLADGSFSLAISPGAYRVQASHQGYLIAAREESVVQVGETTSLSKLTLVGGDVNGDGKINIFDLVMVGVSYGTRRGEAEFRSEADINGSGQVDIFDLVIIGKNYGKAAPTVW